MTSPFEDIYIPLEPKRRSSYEFVKSCYDRGNLVPVSKEDVGKKIQLMEILSLGKRPRKSYLGTLCRCVIILSVFKSKVSFLDLSTMEPVSFYTKSCRFYKVISGEAGHDIVPNRKEN